MKKNRIVSQFKIIGGKTMPQINVRMILKEIGAETCPDFIKFLKTKIDGHLLDKVIPVKGYIS